MFIDTFKTINYKTDALINKPSIDFNSYNVYKTEYVTARNITSEKLIKVQKSHTTNVFQK